MTPTEIRVSMLAHGWKPVPIRTGQKYPALDDWTLIATAASPESVAKWPANHGSTGVLCGQVLGVDIDVLDPARADEIEQLAMEHLGFSRLRRVGAKGVVLVYRMERGAIDWQGTPMFLLPDGLTKEQVEVRGSGQQFVAYGRHPDTGNDYTWGDCAPHNTRVDEVPAVTLQQLREYLLAAEAVLRAAGGRAIERTGAAATRQADTVKTMSDLAPPSADMAVRLLNDMPNPAEAGRDLYVRVMMAAQGCIAGLRDVGDDEDDIADAAVEWAARWPGSPGEAAEREKWEADFATRDRALAGWQNLLVAAAELGVNVDALRVETAQAEFPPLPEAPEASAHWASMLLRSEKGAPLPIQKNAMLVLMHHPAWQGVLGADEFCRRAIFRKAPPWHDPSKPFAPREVADADATEATCWLQTEGVRLTSDAAVWKVMMAVAHRNSFDPLRDALAALKWDGRPRIDTWLMDYLGVENTPLHRAYGAKWLIAGAARGMRPGCKVDTMLVLEGPQGLGKSSALAALALRREWFVDHVPCFESKAASEQIQGKQILEIAEMAIGKAAIERQKQFITTATDRFRAAYDKTAEDHPRRCIFAATINPGSSGEYLTDETGNRRWWPVRCGATWQPGRKVDVTALAAVRDQLWAEAVARAEAGEAWWLDAGMEAEQTRSAAERVERDAWHDTVAVVIDGKDRITVTEIAAALGIVTKDRTRATDMRIARVLKLLGWNSAGQRAAPPASMCPARMRCV